ncbi:MAG: 50S ribosomal protein L6 [Elusimicrobia bacterium]|nr:50S ribosomal protein L6 [Elusimicrobiota bacterium]
MSRIGRAPIPLPDEAKVAIQNGAIELSGPKGKLTQALPPQIQVRQEGKLLHVEPLPGAAGERLSALHGLARALVANAVHGVTQGFNKSLEIQGVGYRAHLSGTKLVLQLGFSHPVDFPIPPGITVTVEKPTLLVVSGVDRQLVGETAAGIRQLRPPEPYNGTGIRYLGEYVLRKAGKAAAGAAGGAGAKKPA